MAKEDIASFQKLSAAEASESVCIWERVTYRVICAENDFSTGVTVYENNFRDRFTFKSTFSSYARAISPKLVKFSLI